MLSKTIRKSNIHAWPHIEGTLSVYIAQTITTVKERGIIMADQHFRSNKEIEAAVNRGLAVAMMDDMLQGANVMRHQGVPAHVVNRVLLVPTLRRSTDWKQEGGGKK